MAQIYERTLKRIKQLKFNNQSKISREKKSPNGSNQSQLYQFFQSLLYGNWANKNRTTLRHYNFYTKRSSVCAIFLNESHVELLTCVDVGMTGIRRYFNMKKVQILEMHSEYQMDQNLQNEKYLVLKQKEEEIILLFQQEQVRNEFRESLSRLREFFEKIPNMYDPLILKAFIKADTNQNDEISWQQLKTLVRYMKIELNQSIKLFIKKILKKQKLEKIYFSDFERMWKIFYCREELGQVFQKYNNQKFSNFDDYLSPVLDVNQFRKFLIEEQKQTPEYSKKVIEELFSSQKTSISFYNFCLYVMGPSNNLINQSYKNYKINTSKPLNHYHCYSSHNTYLTGNQLTSASRVQRYIIDLQNGLRCVQIDIHDGSNGPIVKHGFTLTSQITFRKVIEIINRFTKINQNHTPIILSLQNHCGQENQIQIANIIKEIFSDRILTISPQLKQFPTLQACMGKIIVKGPGNFQLFIKSFKRKQQILLEDQCSQNSEDQQQEKAQIGIQKEKDLFFSEQYYENKTNFKRGLQRLEINKNKFLINKKLFKKLKDEPRRMLEVLTKLETQKDMEQKHEYHHKYKVSSKLLNITSILSKAKLQNQQNCHWQSLSFGQKKILSFAKNLQNKKQIQRLSSLKWFRSYPGGMRIDSSNYNPLPALQLGIQIIALNTQKQDDVYAHILKSLFSKGINISSGYIQRCMQKNAALQENNSSEKDKLIKMQITFISALRIYQNEQDEVDIPQVSIETYFMGTQRDNELNHSLLVKKCYTDTIQKNSFNPKFKKVEPIQIKCRDIQLGFLIVQIPYCGRSVVPLQSVKNGWRVISLFDHELKQKQSRILCKIKVCKTKE